MYVILKLPLGGKSLRQYYTNNGRIGFITGKNLNGNTEMTYINDEGYKICKNSIVKMGEILIPEVYNNNSKSIIVPEEWNNYVFKGSFRLNNYKVNKYYLLSYINSQIFKNQATKSTQGSIFEHITVDILQKATITVPKNKSLSKALNKKFIEIEELQSTIKKTEDKYQQVLQELKKDAIIGNDGIKNVTKDINKKTISKKNIVEI